MSQRTDLPPGPRLPVALQGMGFWTRPLAFMERCREQFGKRFTVQLPLAPPFVYLSEPDQVKQMFTAPPEVLHPGQGARVLEPLVGSNSVILLDEAAHMEQRKLLLPAFHGEKMVALADLMAEVADREVAEWPRGEPIELHSRMQDVTLEIILRAVVRTGYGSATGRAARAAATHPRVRRAADEHAARQPPHQASRAGGPVLGIHPAPA